MTHPAKKYRIAVNITTTAPMHITALEKGFYDISKRAIRRTASSSDSSGLIGCGLTRTVKIFSAAEEGEGDMAGILFVPEVPVIPASTLAGKIRRAAADLLFASLVERNMVIRPETYNTMTCGMATTKLNAEQATPLVMRAARQDPFLGLFGGTSLALSAGCVIAEGWPLLEITAPMIMGEPMAPLAPASRLREMTSAVAVVRRNDVADFRGSQLEGVVGLDALLKYCEEEALQRSESQNRKNNDRAAAKAAKDAAKQGLEVKVQTPTEPSKKTDLRALNAMEVINPGMTFALRFEVLARTPAHLGLMLLSVQKLLQEGQMGGRGARGFGRFDCDVSRLYEVDPSSRESTVLASLFYGRESGYAFRSHDLVDDAVMQAQDYIHNAQPALFDAFAKGDANLIEQIVYPEEHKKKIERLEKAAKSQAEKEAQRKAEKKTEKKAEKAAVAAAEGSLL